ncbi:MAG: hypothetical protein Fur0010_27540 [Bdellovibrio sp.]
MTLSKVGTGTMTIEKKQIKTLDECSVGDVVQLIDFSSNTSVYFKFLALGMMPLDQVTVTGRAPFGGPITLKHSSETYFALRLSEARHIKVERIS